MDTKILQPSGENLDICASAIRAGELVAFPTETVYGLGANALDESAVKKIYAAKGRPSDNPLIVHLSDKQSICRYAQIPPQAAPIIQAFMPGAITILLPKKPCISSLVTGGRQTVGIRIPSNAVALDFLSRCGVPVCAPSANTSSRPSPTKAKHVFDDLGGRIGYILDGGDCTIGIESTIVDLSGARPVILRRGRVSELDIERVLSQSVSVLDTVEESLCPGLKYKHYSPKAEVLLVEKREDALSKIAELYDSQTASGKKCVILCYSQNVDAFHSRVAVGAGKDDSELAANFYSLMREADKRGVDTIILEAPSASPIGKALLNRMSKASGGKIF